MGRRPCCFKEGVNRGAWSLEEDRILSDYVNAHGEGKWGALSRRAGLKRCGKSCRLRWLNYLRPGIKRGNFTEDEEDLIIRLHKLLGNRWSLIAGRLPGRSDNEIKNYWNTKLRKKMEESINESKHLKKKPATTLLVTTSNSDQLVQTKAGKCTKAFPLQHDQIPNEICASSPSIKDLDFNVAELLESNILESISMKVSDERMQENKVAVGGAWPSSCHFSPFKEDPTRSWGITQFPALDALDPSDENSQENGGVIGGWEILYGQYCNIWHDFNQGDSEIWWMGDSFQVNGEPELKV